MNKIANRVIILFLSLIVSCGISNIGIEPPGLRNLADRCDISIGAAVAVNPLLNDFIYTNVLAREFNILTPENTTKFGPIHPKRDLYTFSGGDDIVSFARANDMRIRGHVLVWHNQLPEWITQNEWTTDELIEILQQHITTVVSHYRGEMFAWDVANEAILEDGSYRETIWYNVIGPEYLEMAFQWAHESDPNALLFYNDYSAESLNEKSDAVYNLVKNLRDKEVPIHGVGLQMHIRADDYPDPVEVIQNIRRLADLGLEVHITELDVRIRKPVTQQDLLQQAEVYQQMLDLCLDSPSCTALVLWGFTDKYSWIPNFFEGWNAGLIFDEAYQPKPAYDSLKARLQECK